MANNLPVLRTAFGSTIFPTISWLSKKIQIAAEINQKSWSCTFITWRVILTCLRSANPKDFEMRNYASL